MLQYWTSKCEKLYYRRGVRYSLSSLFVATTLCSVWLGCEASHLRRHARAIAIVRNNGGAVFYDYQWRGSGWDVNAVPPGPKWIRKLLGDNYRSDVVEVHIFADKFMTPEKITDSEASQLGVLTEIKWLVLMDTKITDAGLKHFCGMTKLERLDLEGSRVTRKGAEELHRMLPKATICFGDDIINP